MPRQVNAPKEIVALSNDPSIDRAFDTRTCPVNWFLLKRALSVLSYEGRRFPTMEPRGDAQRARAQQELFERLSAASAHIRTGPAELAPIAAWIQGAGSDDAIGMPTQQLVGRLFRPDFAATAETWAAARVLVTAPHTFWWFANREIKPAKRLLAESMGGDLSAVNGIGIAVHNIVKGLRHMRTLYADAATRNTLSPQAAAEQCLFAPVSVFRQSTQTRSLFVLNIGKASRQPGGRPLVFMEQSWSGCPASLWVPAMLEGVWRRATETSPG
jgi:hypothetical protein